MPVKINGLPAHVLLIHVVIVLVPLAALMLIASAVWPKARAKLGFLTPAVALVALVMVPVTTNAGVWFRDHIGFTSAALRRHTQLGTTLLPWAIGVFVMASAVWLLGRYYEMGWRQPAPEQDEPIESPGGGGGTATLTRPVAVKQALPVWVTAIVAAVSVVVAVGAMVQLYRIGDSGAKAVWGGRV